jgi:carbon storage regulator
MLVLSRKLNETIVIDGNIRITVVGIHGNHVRLGIAAPDQVPILREELLGSARPGENGSSLGVRPEAWGLDGKAAHPVPTSSSRPS